MTCQRCDGTGLMQDGSGLPCGNCGGVISEGDAEVRIPSNPGEKQEGGSNPLRMPSCQPVPDTLSKRGQNIPMDKENWNATLELSKAFADGYRDGWNVARAKAAELAREHTGCHSDAKCKRADCQAAREISGKISRMERT